MASVAITIPTALVPRVRAAMRATFPDLVALSDAAAFQEATAAYWRSVVVQYEADAAQDAANATARATANAARTQATTDAATIV